MDSGVAEVIKSVKEPILQGLLKDYLESNEAARLFIKKAQQEGRPVVLDHLAIRCFDVEERAQPFLQVAYRFEGELVEYPDQGWWAKVYRRENFPSLFIDQAYTDARGEKSILLPWVAQFGDRVLHHIAVRVDDIEHMMEVLKSSGVEFSGEIVGPRGTRLRQIFTVSEVRDGKAFSVLELAERNQYEGFVPEQADGLMQSSVKTKGSLDKGK